MNVVSGPTAGEVVQTLVCEIPSQRTQTEVCATFLSGIKRRLARERRRRTVGRAYDMAVEIARLVPKGSNVLDVGCGNGLMAHHLSAMLGTKVLGIDVFNAAEAPIDYRRYDGSCFPLAGDSVDAVLFCYVLHHAQDVHAALIEARRVLRAGGLLVIYEDIPRTSWDKLVCWIHNRRWQHRTGPCRFHVESDWRELFERFGFELVHNRRLSRWRNLTHPVDRVTFLLRALPIDPEGYEANRRRTRLRTPRDVLAPRRWNYKNRQYRPSSAA